MSDSYLVFSNVSEANTREAQLSVALGYPDATGVYTYYCTPDQHPTSGEAALIITTVCATDKSPSYLRDAETLLTQPEIDTLKTEEEMRDAGWWPEEPAP